MTAALALLPIILQYLPTMTVGVEQLIAWITSVRTAASQASVWTPELETAFLEALIATKTTPAYQLDPAAAVPPALPKV